MSSSSRGSKHATLDASSPQRFGTKLTEPLAYLAIDTKQCAAVSYFIQATKQPVSVAVQTLGACQWDLIEAVSRFGENYKQTQEEPGDSSVPVIEPIRSRSSSPSPTRHSRRGEGSSISSTTTTATHCRELHPRMEETTREVFGRLLRIRLRSSTLH